MALKLVLSFAGIAAVAAAIWFDWRAAILMLVAWWFDNMVRKLNDE